MVRRPPVFGRRRAGWRKEVDDILREEPMLGAGSIAVRLGVSRAAVYVYLVESGRIDGEIGNDSMCEGLAGAI